MWGSMVGGVRENGEGRGRRQGGRELPCHKAPVDVSSFTLTSVTSYFPCPRHSHLPPAAGTAVMFSRQPLQNLPCPHNSTLHPPRAGLSISKKYTMSLPCLQLPVAYRLTCGSGSARLGSGRSARSGPPRPCISARPAPCPSSDAPHCLYMSMNHLNRHAFSS